jgi:hypothetical protein
MREAVPGEILFQDAVHVEVQTLTSDSDGKLRVD